MAPPYLPGDQPPDGFPGLDGPDAPGGPGRPGARDLPGGPSGAGGSDGPGSSGEHGNQVRATMGGAAREQQVDRRVPVLLLALAFALTAGIGITLGSWLGFPGRADSGQQPGAGSSPRRRLPPGPRPRRARRRRARRSRRRSCPRHAQKTLRQALALVNATVWTTGFLPPK